MIAQPRPGNIGATLVIEVFRNLASLVPSCKAYAWHIARLVERDHLHGWANTSGCWYVHDGVYLGQENCTYQQSGA